MATKKDAVSLRSLLPYLRDHRPTLVVVAVLSLLGSVTTLAQPLLTRDVLDGLQASEAVGRTVALLVVVLAAVALLNALRDYLLQRTAEGLVLTARRRLTRHLLRLPITEYDQRRTGDLLSRVGADTTLLRAVVTSGLFETVTGAVMVVGAAGAMLLLDPILFLTAGGGLALGLSIAVVFSRRVRPASQEAQARIGDMTSAVERALTAARTIRASNAEEREAVTVEAGAEEAYRAGVRIAKLQALVGPASVAAIQGAFLLLLGVGGARVANGTISVGDLVAFVLYLFFLVMPLGQALHAYTQLQTGLGALQRMHDILDVPLEEDAGTATVTDSPVAVSFDGVTFGYAGSLDTVVRDVSFSVAYGTRTALVGPSGAGKSTLLQLVERFYDATGGTVRVAGVDVQHLPRQVLRAQLGYVEQEAPVLAGTLRDNLRLAAPAASDAQMFEVLDAVNLAEIVQRTPLGLDAQVGEGGVLLSGGERQRLAIARTLLAAPPILLLDEPTSNLDARNEVALRQAIDTVAHNRTMIVVAHRLSTVVDADQIVVMEGGRVVAVGRHADLLESSDLYRELATNQLLVA
ncbi:ABC transporter ATP-binding protein/permease [Dactylosporangium sp. NBC_01737]|uniref:ABC transporter ATP-binding protein n=1 Tax=Dactylosporangium sp. NBC_01737 TaxID=2975959 RepID=UPI002E109A1E|nr:ABC transporter ATP-binding protein/permease [Dactylosporangium sp. NBC_01737]